MKGSKNCISNREARKITLCPHCKTEVVPVMYIRAGKKRMMGTCKCAVLIKHTADIKHLLGA